MFADFSVCWKRKPWVRVESGLDADGDSLNAPRPSARRMQFCESWKIELMRKVPPRARPFNADFSNVPLTLGLMKTAVEKEPLIRF